MAAAVTEVEAKFDAPADVALPALDSLPGVARTSGPHEHELTAEYFDTADLRLLRAGITLRRRVGGTDAGWHLKLPAGPQTRTEIRLPLAASDTEVPDELAGLVRARSRQMPLRLVATLVTRRRTTVLEAADGAALAEVADDDVTGTRPEESGPGVHWREVEVELAGGSPAMLDAATELLRQAGLRPAAAGAKLERVLGAFLPQKGSQPELTGSTPACQVVTAYLGRHAEVLARLDPLVRRDEPDSVHQMRVATRRLRSALRMFGDVTSRAETAQLADELQWLGGVLGRARDAEVQAGRMRQQIQDIAPEQLLGPVSARVQAHFARAGAQARTDVLAALSSARYYALLDALDAVITDPPLGPDGREHAARALPSALRRSYRAARRQMRRAHAVPPGPDRDARLHQARKAAKRARYAAETVAPVFGKDASRLAGHMKEVQTALGDHQDTVVGRELARDLGIEAYHAGENAFSYGLIYGREVAAGQRLQKAALRAWRRTSRPRDRRWLKAGRRHLPRAGICHVGHAGRHAAGSGT